MSAITQPTAAPSASALARLSRRRPLTSYFTLAFALSWTLVLPMTLSTNLGLGLLPYALPDALGLALYLLASLVGPTAAALVVTGLAEGRAGVVMLLRRTLRWRVGPRWYAAALLANLTIWLLGYSAILGPGLLTAALVHWPLLLTSFLPMVAFGIVIPLIGEEPGWRGFALPRLQARHGPLRATLILGALHGLWHLPALGTLMLGPLTAAQLGPFLLTAMGGTFLYTWIFNRTGGSVLLAILTHAAGNAASQWLTALIDQSGLVLPESDLASCPCGAAMRRRSEEFATGGGPPPATLETVGWTLDELLEEAEDPDYATHNTSRVRDLGILRDLVAFLQSGRPTDPPRQPEGKPCGSTHDRDLEPRADPARRPRAHQGHPGADGGDRGGHLGADRDERGHPARAILLRGSAR